MHSGQQIWLWRLVQEFQAEQKRSEGAAASGKLSENWSLSQVCYFWQLSRRSNVATL